MRILLFIAFLFGFYFLEAQFQVASPVIATGDYSITDTVYMSPLGDDGNPGTEMSPVRSFQVALQKIPFGTPGILGGHRYGLIRLLPGYYQTSTGFQQGENQWKSGNTYKNISVEGIGTVIIGGTPDAPASNHALRLVGDHIYIHNVQLRHTEGIGLLINRSTATPDLPGPSHIRIDNVTIDSTGSHGLLIVNADYVEVRNSRVLHASRRNFSELPQSACSSWPSGLKLHFSKHIRIRNCEVAYTRGEGLNFHNCQYGLAENNRLHDNPTNFYNDNSARLIVRKNYLYNTPGLRENAFMCPQNTTQSTLQGIGMLIANEGSCADASHTPSFDNCRSRCFSLAGTYTFPTVDSIFVYNNILHNCGGAFSFWQGDVGIIGRNCIQNVFIVNNTVIGVAGDTTAPGAMVRFFFPDANPLINTYSQMINVRFHGNIITYDQDVWTSLLPVSAVLNPLISHDVSGNYNLWRLQHPWMAAQDVVRADLPVHAGIADTIPLLWPCEDLSPSMVWEVPVFAPWLDTDFWGGPRHVGETNAGAIEYNCALSTRAPGWRSTLRYWPNPAGEQLWVDLPSGERFRIYDAMGRLMLEERSLQQPHLVYLQGFLPGVYLLRTESGSAGWLVIAH